MAAKNGNNLSFGLSSSDTEEFAPEKRGSSGEGNGQRPFASLKSRRAASKLPEDEGEKPKNPINKFPHRGEVYWVDLEPTRGKETQKIRPGLVVSNDIGNELSKIIMIAPITSKVSRIYPTEVKTLVDGKEAKIMLHQCRAIDKSRLSKKICEVSLETMVEVEKAIKIVFALP